VAKVDTEIRKPVPPGGRRCPNRGANGYENLKTGFVRPAAGVLLTVARMDTKIGDPVSSGGRRLALSNRCLAAGSRSPQQAVRRLRVPLCRAQGKDDPSGRRRKERGPEATLRHGPGSRGAKPSHDRAARHRYERQCLHRIAGCAAFRDYWQAGRDGHLQATLTPVVGQPAVRMPCVRWSRTSGSTAAAPAWHPQAACKRPYGGRRPWASIPES
jgi:hypothetical protein